MSLISSLIYNIKEAKFNPFTLIHETLYGATVTYLKILFKLLRRENPSFRKHVEETYHSKVVRLEDASRFISVNRDVDLRNLDQILPYEYAKDIILKNPQNIVAYECACRGQKENPCQPTDVCLVVGEPFADLVRILQPFRNRRISAGEALEIIKEEDQRGHYHTAWFKTAMLNRFYAICNCCSCCCLGKKTVFEYGMRTVLPSGYRATMGEECVGCGECEKHCQFDAIEMMSFRDNGKEKKRAKVISENCFGCGVCESKCKKENISLVLDPSKGVPLNIESLERAYTNP